MMHSQLQQGFAGDAEIIAGILAGNTALFELLVRRYNGVLYKIARSYGLSHEDAQDVMQEAHVCAFRALPGFRSEASYKTWLAKIALHLCYRKLHTAHARYEQPEGAFITGQITTMQATSARQPERAVINKELARVLEESLQALPLMYRSVFVLREIEGFSVAETAELMGITPVNVKVRMNRARTMLQKQIEGYYSTADIYEFNLKYCDAMVAGVFRRIEDGG